MSKALLFLLAVIFVSLILASTEDDCGEHGDIILRNMGQKRPNKKFLILPEGMFQFLITESNYKPRDIHNYCNPRTCKSDADCCNHTRCKPYLRFTGDLRCQIRITDEALKEEIEELNHFNGDKRKP